MIQTIWRSFVILLNSYLMENNYWIDFWAAYGAESRGRDDQARVMRTLNKQPVSDAQWALSLQHISTMLSLNETDVVLDLCCGNGLISKHIARKCSHVTSVDISKDLLDEIDANLFTNITTVCKDIRELELPENHFSRIIIYSSLQYLSYRETVFLFEHIYLWLKKDGIAFIGDIPDLAKLWVFFNSKERESAYFESLKNQKEIIGTWFDKEWLQKLSSFTRFKQSAIIEQHPEMIYSFFRYDMRLVK